MHQTPTSTLPSTSSRLRDMPISFFAVVMGLSGVTIATHKVETQLGFAGVVSAALFWLAAGLFVLLAVAYGRKAALHRDAVVAEWRHPVRISFFPTVSVSLVLLGTASLAIDGTLSLLLWATGSALHLLLTVLVMTSWINHSRYEVVHINPAWFIPVVGNVLVPLAGLKHAPADLSWLFFSVGLVFWLVLLTIVFNRLVFHHPLPGRLVPTMFILLAPPSVAFISYVALAGGVDGFARLLYFSAVFFFLLLIPQLSRFAKLDFALSWWAYSFPLAAFTVATLLMGEWSGITFYTDVGLALFAILVVLIAMLTARTIVAVSRREICRPEGA